MVLTGQGVGHVEQRRGRRHRDLRAKRRDRVKSGERLVEIGAPNVVAVDDARRDRDTREVNAGGDAAANKVETNCLDGGCSEHGECVVERAHRRRNKELRAVRLAAEELVRTRRVREHVGTIGVNVGNEHGLVNLHPLSAGSLERGEKLGVNREQVTQASDRVEALRSVVRCLREVEEGERTGDDGTRDEARVLTLDKLINPAGR